ncbi:hypothetical protein [Asanoa siamensis]|uniref:Uncharacterized protein n=1 Tax=Asanoa siamensis TaxID=926357 RepID=A0ABQ4D4Y8_9ACTN|nr:hypothetical protein [Asanoa siamensis]GIF78612.1 hypothetical protein Asi02nite_81300 [Asanoa siamensis]
MVVRTNPDALVKALRSYGEDAVADRVGELAGAELEEIGTHAAELALLSDPSGSNRRMSLAKALALAAVAAIEGTQRPLTLSRRRPGSVRRPKPSIGAPLTTTDERPRDVFQAACVQVAERFAPAGYTYSRSGPHMTRKTAANRYEIAFLSSQYNKPGIHAAMNIFATVTSTTVRRWHTKRGIEHDGAIAGGNLGNLRNPPRWLEWNLADPVGRPTQIDQACATIEELAHPLFDLFDDHDEVARRIAAGSVPQFHGTVNIIAWCVANGYEETAIMYGRRLIDKHPDAGSYRERIALFENTSGLFPRSGIADDLAYAATVYRIRFD